MLRQRIIQALEAALINVPDDQQEIFNKVKVEKEVVLNEQQEGKSTKVNSNERIECSGADGEISERSEQRDAESVSITEEEIEDVEVKSTTTITEYKRVLTPWGARFVNTMLDHASVTYLTEQTMNDWESLENYKYPNINLTKLIDVSGLAYFDKNAQTFKGDKAKVMDYPAHKVENMNFNCDSRGEICDVMDSYEFARTWDAIISAERSKLKDVACNVSLKKEVKYLNDLKVAYKNKKMYKLVSQTVTEEEKIFAHLIKPEWKLNADQFLLSTNDVSISDFQIRNWLISSNGMKSNNNSSFNNKKSNSKKNKVRQAMKNKQSQPQPENDSKAVALNPNHQE